ncbi:hypothetical protein U1872_00720 [Sphingomonas sp. RB3P16]|uniref:hypothetical protein n=1 Tax=Parasphingomonas frigoris TaxID=3096163 RepID=UPI002FC6FE43
MRGTWRIRQFFAKRRLARRAREAVTAVQRFPRIARRESHGLPTELIVTLTSYPGRFATLAATIKSLLDQQILPDRTVLWLGHDDVAKLPEDVLELASHGLEIRGCEDIRSFTKLIPAMTEWPGATLVTADDDVYYPPNWLGGLVEAHRADPDNIIAWRAHVARADPEGRLARYVDWEFATSRTHVDEPFAALFPTGVGGVLYPSGSLHPDVFDQDAFTTLCPRNDDVWFYWMAKRAGTRHSRVDGWIDLIEWPSSQQIGLRVDNVEGDGNDRQIRAVEGAYGAFPF